MSNKEVDALISLLDDPDGNISGVVEETLLKKGKDIIPDLEKAWEKTVNEALQEKLEALIQEIQFNSTQKCLLEWINEGAENIFEGAVYLAQFQFPDVSLKQLDSEIEKIYRDVVPGINENLTALDKVKIINHVIFDKFKYTRNSANFYSPQNSYINQVIESRKGNPISLSIIYLSVAHKLKLPVYGVNLPKNFILAYKDEFRQQDMDDGTDILFYINPYNKGTVLGRREIDYFIKQQNLQPDRAFYVPCSNTDILIRLINNLVLSYEKLGFQDKIDKLKKLIKIIVPAD